jgi:hypothetical protein
MGILADLASFLRDRWDEEKEDTTLFHELDCVTPDDSRAVICRCPYPREVFEQLAINRRILAGLEERIARDEREGGWPLDSTLAFASMRALVLPHELHPAWQDTWYP